MKKFFVVMILILIVSYSSAVPINNDLWDVSQGTIVTGSSEICSGPEDMFGASSGWLEPGNTIFGNSEDGIHWIQWETVNPIHLDGFRLYANIDGTNGRAFDYFSLLYQDEEGIYIPIFNSEISVPYELCEIEANLVMEWLFETTIIAERFEARFRQCGFEGTRIIELDSFGIESMPEPATISLAVFGVLIIRRRFIK